MRLKMYFLDGLVPQKRDYWMYLPTFIWIDVRKYVLRCTKHNRFFNCIFEIWPKKSGCCARNFDWNNSHLFTSSYMGKTSRQEGYCQGKNINVDINHRLNYLLNHWFYTNLTCYHALAILTMPWYNSRCTFLCTCVLPVEIYGHQTWFISCIYAGLF